MKRKLFFKEVKKVINQFFGLKRRGVVTKNANIIYVWESNCVRDAKSGESERGIDNREYRGNRGALRNSDIIKKNWVRCSSINDEGNISVREERLDPKTDFRRKTKVIHQVDKSWMGERIKEPFDVHSKNREIVRKVFFFDIIDRGKKGDFCIGS